jgi:hypothetical protein
MCHTGRTPSGNDGHPGPASTSAGTARPTVIHVCKVEFE